jgi:hypothetical protein
MAESNITDAFDAPWPQLVPGRDEAVPFAKFDLDELAKLGAEVKALRKRETEALIKENAMPPADAFQARKDAAWAPVLDGDIDLFVQTPEGTKKTLELSLLKSGFKESAERGEILKKIDPQTKKFIALIVTGIAVPKPKKAEQGEVVASDGGPAGFGDVCRKGEDGNLVPLSPDGGSSGSA